MTSCSPELLLCVYHSRLSTVPFTLSTSQLSRKTKPQPTLAALSLRSPQELPSPSRSKGTMHNVADVRRGLRGWDLRRHAGGHTVPEPSTAEKILRRVAPNTRPSQPRCCETGRRPRNRNTLADAPIGGRTFIKYQHCKSLPWLCAP